MVPHAYPPSPLATSHSRVSSSSDISKRDSTQGMRRTQSDMVASLNWREDDGRFARDVPVVIAFERRVTATAIDPGFAGPEQRPLAVLRRRQQGFRRYRQAE